MGNNLHRTSAISDEIYTQLELIAKMKNLSISEVIQNAYSEYLEKNAQDIFYGMLLFTKDGREFAKEMIDHIMKYSPNFDKKALSVNGTISKKNRRLYENNKFKRLVESGQINIDDTLYLKYGLKGEEKLSFIGIVKENGILLNGKICSPSAAAVECMKNAGSNGISANGWIMWMNSKGQTLNQLYQHIAKMRK